MEIEFDPAKDRANAAKHGLSLLAAEGFDWNTALEREDDRFEDAPLAESALRSARSALREDGPRAACERIWASSSSSSCRACATSVVSRREASSPSRRFWLAATFR